MKYFITICLLAVNGLVFSQGRVLTLLPPSGDISAYNLFDFNDTIYCPIEKRAGSGSNRFLRLDYDLNIIDTLILDPSRDSLSYYLHMEINSKTYVLLREIQNGVPLYYARSLTKGKFTDSIFLPIDTIKRARPARVYDVDSNTLRMVVAKYDVNYQHVLSSVILDLDSNFNVKEYHAIEVQAGVSNWISLITSVSVINDTLWHVHSHGELYLYNPRSRETISGRKLYGTIQDYYRVNATQYLGFGTVGKSTVPGQSGNYTDALGFYRVNAAGNVVDKYSYSVVTDSSTYGTYGYINYAIDNAQSSNTVLYDTNSIFVAGQSVLLKQGPNDYFFVIFKINSKGQEIWRYKWEAGADHLAVYKGILPTADKGCIVLGVHLYEYPVSLKTQVILIKLGPDGTISNVEFNAPETVVSFYPNPVKDRLHYSMLEAGNGPYLLEVYDMQGKPVLEASLSDEENHIPVNLNKGFYLYQLKSEAGKVEQVGKLVVE